MNPLKHLADGFIRTPFHPQWLLGMQRPVELIGKLRGLVLDVGCASRWAERHLPADAHYISTDFPATGAALYEARPDFFADAAALPLSTESVDAVICLEVMEHVRSPERAASELARVTRPGGILLLSVPFLYPIHDAPHDYRRYTLHGLEELLAAAGYELLDVRRRGHAIAVAGAMLSMALVGWLSGAHRTVGFLLLPPLAIAVLSVNLTCKLLAICIPDWPALSAGYLVKARKRLRPDNGSHNIRDQLGADIGLSNSR